MRQSSRAGEFPYTVDIQQPTDSEELDAYGHKQSTFATVAQAAARVWTSSRGGSSSDPTDLNTESTRLLLREPSVAIRPGWQIIWKAGIYKVDASEEREFDLLVTLVPVG